MIKKLMAVLESANAEYRAAQVRGSGITTARERLKNILFNNMDDIYAALKESMSMQEEIDALDAALKEADDALKKREGEAKRGSGKGRDEE